MAETLGAGQTLVAAEPATRMHVESDLIAGPGALRAVCQRCVVFEILAVKKQKPFTVAV